MHRAQLGTGTHRDWTKRTPRLKLIIFCIIFVHRSPRRDPGLLRCYLRPPGGRCTSAVFPTRKNIFRIFFFVMIISNEKMMNENIPKKSRIHRAGLRVLVRFMGNAAFCSPPPPLAHRVTTDDLQRHPVCFSGTNKHRP